MKDLKMELERVKAKLNAKHDEAKTKSYSWGRITTVGAACFVVGMIVGNLLAREEALLVEAARLIYDKIS